MMIRMLSISLSIFLSWGSSRGVAAIPESWNVQAAPTTQDLNAVAYGHGIFVAVGEEATILTSPDGANWTQRSAGAGTSSFGGTVAASSSFVAGGGGALLIRTSTDAVHWTNGVASAGAEHINALAFGYGLFVGVGRGAEADSSYILTSSNGVDWIARSAPTTNRLLAVAPAIGANGVGWADSLFVAVGERGTILTSTNGMDWVSKHSGTTVTLRAVEFAGRFLVGGDSGTILTSSDGTTWMAEAPTSFTVRGVAAQDFDTVVAVGNYEASGRLHVSVDAGSTWPGQSAAFGAPLNGIAFGGGAYVAVGDQGLIVRSENVIAGGTNEWTKATSGYWEEPYWSLGRLPGSEQELVAFRNPGYKALAIGANTTANYPDSLAIQNLRVEGPANSANQLLLNYAGLSVPLSISGEFVLGTNASLVSYYSALRGGNFYLSSPAAFSEGSIVDFDKIELQANGEASLSLTNASLTADELILGPASVQVQAGGSAEVSNLVMFAGTEYLLNAGTLSVSNVDLLSVGGTGLAQFTMNGGAMEVQGVLRLGQPQFMGADARGEFTLTDGSFHAREVHFLNGAFTQTGGTNTTETMAIPLLDYGRGEYFLSGGSLATSNLVLGAVLNPATPSGSADFAQSGGVHTNVNLRLYGEIRRQAVTHYGQYSLSAGLLVSESIQLIGGAFLQSGGTNEAEELVLDDAGFYLLNNGWLVTSNTIVDTCCCVRSDFVQSNGVHRVENRLLLQDFVQYVLEGGRLEADHLEIGPGAELVLQGGSISNGNLLTFRGGAVRAAGQTQEFGQLQVLGEPVLICVSTQPAGPTLDVGLGGNGGATVVRFRDSRDVGWSGTPLQILHWSPTAEGYGPDHIFVGTNAQGLTPAQLSQVRFVDPYGWAPGSYPARMLETGELVPELPPLLSFERNENALTLTWIGDYKLVTATNVAGPYLAVEGATSPYAVQFTNPQQFFRLRSPIMLSIAGIRQE